VGGGWHGGGPFLAYAGGRDAWDWRSAWGGWGGRIWGPEFNIGLGGWAWGGIALGAGIGFIIAPPVYILPPPIYALPPPVVLGLPAIEPLPIMDLPPPPAPPPPLAAAALSTSEMVAAAVPPPIVVSPPPYIVAEAPPPPVIFAPQNFAFAIAPPVLAFSVIGPAYYSGGFFTGGYITRGYYGAVWDRPYLRTRVRYERPGFFGRIGLGHMFGGGTARQAHFYGPPGGGWHGGGFHGGGGLPGGGRGGDFRSGGGHGGRQRG
jgi:hypothetical protein